MFGLLSLDVAAMVAALLVTLSITGVRIGLIAVPMTSALLGGVDPSRSGIASGILTAFRQTGSVLGVALFGSLLAGMGALPGLRTASVIAAALILVVGPLNLTVGEERMPAR